MENLKFEKRNTLTLVLFAIYLLALLLVALLLISHRWVIIR